ncbi:MAG: esterase [Chloroflexota bacterium]
MKKLITTLGDFAKDDLGIILPHEHIFVDLGPIEEKNYLQARAEEVIPVISPEIEKIKKQGVTAFVECTPTGVGRRADIDRAVSEATDLPVVVPTGIYREPWVPEWVQTASEDQIADWMLAELTEEIEESGVRAAWIKVSAGDDGITDLEAKILRAAAKAGTATGAIIGSHTIRGSVVQDQLDIIEKAGYTSDRFIWIHTQNEPDLQWHTSIAQRGAWIEYDGLGRPPHDDIYYIDRLHDLIEAGLSHKVLLSHDQGWFDPSKPGGGTPKPYTYLVDHFIPQLKEAGFSQEIINQWVCQNPFDAFAR